MSGQASILIGDGIEQDIAAASMELHRHGLPPWALETLLYPQFGELFRLGADVIEGSDIATLISPWDPEHGRDVWEKAMSGDGDAGIAAAVLTPNCARGLLVQIAYRDRMPVPAFRDLLNSVWDHDHAWLTRRPKMVAWKAVQQTRLRAMFKYADFDVSHLPETITVYRGARAWGHPSRVTGGLSWTLNRGVAALFALRFSGPEGAPPIVVRADVSRARVLAHINSRCEDECIIFGIRNARIDRMLDASLRVYTCPTRKALLSWKDAAARRDRARRRRSS